MAVFWGALVGQFSGGLSSVSTGGNGGLAGNTTQAILSDEPIAWSLILMSTAVQVLIGGPMGMLQVQW